MALGIQQFKSNFYGGARNNLFKVVMTPPQAETGVGKSLEFLIKTTSLPSSTVEPLTVPFRGRDLKIAGKRSFEPWSVTVINDNDFLIRETLEKWSASMSYHDINTSDKAGQGDDGFAHYMCDAQVYQLIHDNKDHKVGYGYNFVDMWPSSVGNIELNSEGEAIEEFTVEFQYQYWYSQKTNSENVSESGAYGISGSAANPT